MTDSIVPNRSERGVALVMALLVLLVLAMLSAVLMASINVETKLGGHSMRTAQALNTAEAGIAEAKARIQTGEIPDNNNPRMVAQIFNVLPGSVPALGADSVGLATAQPGGAWLNYTSTSRGPNALTVKYKTNAANPPTVIYRYDPVLNPAVQTASGYPIFVIESTGIQGKDVRRIRSEVIRKPVLINVRAALAANVPIEFKGTSDVCGYNHDMNTPAGTAGQPSCVPWQLGSQDLPAGWSSGPISSQGAAQQWGSPTWQANQSTPFYKGPWEALGMTQAEFFQWIGAPQSTAPQPPRGIIYLDNNGTSQDQSGDFAYNGGDGEGLLYVDGDLTINGNFTFRGMIYVEGNVKVNGTCWVLGSMIARGKTEIKHANGTARLLWSRDAVTQNIAKHGGQFVTLAWKEL